MGVIRNLSSLQNGYSDSIEDVLNEIEDQVQNLEQQPEPIRRVRKVRNRTRPHAVGGPTSNPRTKSGKKKKRIENFNYLLSLADPEEVIEITIHDFIPPSASVFSQICLEWENMEMWNEFINCTDVEACLNAITAQKKSLPPNQDLPSGSNVKDDKRLDHSAFSAVECFKKVDNDLRCLLKRHIPMGPLTHMEHELITFFMNRPRNIFQSYIPNSFERLLLHALCQYMDLSSLSYNRNGARWTRVRNNRPEFILPSMLLSTFLENYMKKRSR